MFRNSIQVSQMITRILFRLAHSLIRMELTIGGRNYLCPPTKNPPTSPRVFVTTQYRYFFLKV